MLYKERIAEIREGMKRINQAQTGQDGQASTGGQSLTPNYELLVIDYSMPETRGP